MTQDGAGDLWAGTLNGLARFENGKFRAFASVDGLPNKLITSMYQDSQNALWIGTDGGGLLRWKDGRFRTYSARDGLPSKIIYSILGDPDGTLWLGTNSKGLIRLANGKFTTYTKENGLFDDAIFKVLDDERGRLWISSNRSIASVSRSDLTAFAKGNLRSLSSRNYDAMDGMKNRECNGGFQPAGWRAQDGRLWFPTIQGVAVISPAKLSTSKLPFPVTLECVLADNMPVIKKNRHIIGRKEAHRVSVHRSRFGGAREASIQLNAGELR